jgi:hypothetical protein
MDWDLAKEATEVGALLVPVYAVVREALKGLRFKDEVNKEYLSVFVAGALFHVVAEATGVNEWYLTHGRANRKWLSTTYNADKPSSSRCDGRVCPLAIWASENRGR